MRRIKALATALSLLFVASPLNLSAEEPPIHRDPQTAPEKFNATDVFGLFEGFVDLQAGTDYESAEALLDAVQTGNIPANLQFAVTKYAEQLKKLHAQLGLTAEQLQAASLTPATVNDQETDRILAAAHLLLEGSAVTFGELRNASDELAEKIGAELPSIEGVFSDAFGRMIEFGEVLQEIEQGNTVSLSYMTDIIFETGDIGFPGRALTLSGTVSTNEISPPQAGSFNVKLGDANLTEFVEENPFEQEIILPENLLEGEYELSVEFPAQGIYEEAVFTREIQIFRVRPKVEIQTPSLLIFPRTLDVEGKVTSIFGNVEEASVRVYLGDNASSVRTDSDGNFSLSLDLSLTAFYLGPQSLRTEVIPEEPWHIPANTPTKVTIINIVDMGLLAMIVIYILVFIGFAKKRRKEQSTGPTVGVGMPSGIQGVVNRLVQQPDTFLPTSVEIKGLRAQIMTSYYNAARTLEVRLNISFRPNLTLRDFLALVESQAGETFAKLTRLAEQALYRSRDPESYDPESAEDFAKMIQEGR
jgi:hypothetical protein